MAMSMLIRERCFDCGYIYQGFLSPKAVYSMFKAGKLSQGRARFPKCPDCRKPVQLVSFEEVKQQKGASHGNKKN